jgi:glycogen synthase
MKKRVLMFGWEFPPHNSGGLGVACYGLSKALATQKIEVIFVLPKKLKGVKRDFLKIIDPGVSYRSSYVFNSPLYPYVNSKNYSSLFFDLKEVYGNSLLEEVLRYAEFGRIIAKKEKFDVIHAHDWLSFGAGINAKKISGKPFIAHVHATEFDRCGGESINSLVYRLEKEGMEKADKVIAVSNFTKNIIVKHYGISEEKIEVVHNGVDFSEYETLSRNIHKIKEVGKKLVLFVGRLTLQKGPDYFIKAAQRVCEIRNDVYFIVSGSGDMENFLMEEVARTGLSDRILFTGFLRGNELKEIYREADLFVMPSVSEPFGITPLESLVNGTPVLISRQSGVSEVITHALKADFWDIDDMAGKIMATLSYDSLSSCLTEYGKAEATTITWDNAAKKCINIYNSL